MFEYMRYSSNSGILLPTIVYHWMIYDTTGSSCLVHICISSLYYTSKSDDLDPSL
jgi:hypothetical protein